MSVCGRELEFRRSFFRRSHFRAWGWAWLLLNLERSGESTKGRAAFLVLIRKSFEIVVALQTTRFFKSAIYSTRLRVTRNCPAAGFLFVLPYSTAMRRCGLQSARRRLSVN